MMTTEKETSTSAVRDLLDHKIHWLSPQHSAPTTLLWEEEGLFPALLG